MRKVTRRTSPGLSPQWPCLWPQWLLLTLGYAALLVGAASTRALGIAQLVDLVAVHGSPGLDIGTYTFEDRPPVHLPPGGSSNLSSGNGQQSIDSARFDIIGSGSTDPAMDAASAPGPATVLDFRALTGPAFTLAPGTTIQGQTPFQQRPVSWPFTNCRHAAIITNNHATRLNPAALCHTHTHTATCYWFACILQASCCTWPTSRCYCPRRLRAAACGWPTHWHTWWWCRAASSGSSNRLRGRGRGRAMCPHRHPRRALS